MLDASVAPEGDRRGVPLPPPVAVPRRNVGWAEVSPSNDTQLNKVDIWPIHRFSLPSVPWLSPSPVMVPFPASDS